MLQPRRPMELEPDEPSSSATFASRQLQWRNAPTNPSGVVWDPHTVQDVNKLEMVQRRYAATHPGTMSNQRRHCHAENSRLGTPNGTPRVGIPARILPWRHVHVQTCQHLKITWSNDFFRTHISITRSYVTGHDSVAGCYRVGAAVRPPPPPHSIAERFQDMCGGCNAIRYSRSPWRLSSLI